MLLSGSSFIKLSWDVRGRDIIFFSSFGVFLYFLNNVLKKISDKIILQDKKETESDLSGVNKMLTFGPGWESCPGHIMRNFDCGNLNCNFGKFRYLLSLVEECRESLDVCIYTISAQEFASGILRAFGRGVTVRVIADFDSSFSPSSKVDLFRREGIPVRSKKSDFIMHHKFMVIDGRILLSGSMNFTMTGVFSNWENVMVTSQPGIVKPFVEGFEKLWLEFDPRVLHSQTKSKKS